ncbi:MAG: LLM class F420-dependent oxidoreductase, partial [Aquificales bacterium]|nr:LLM class F420-dependent oxidoreductase [Aquificales bacterium]
LADWQTAGATHITLNTMYLGFDTPEKHIQAMRHFAETIF